MSSLGVNTQHMLYLKAASYLNGRSISLADYSSLTQEYDQFNSIEEDELENLVGPDFGLVKDRSNGSTSIAINAVGEGFLRNNLNRLDDEVIGLLEYEATKVYQEKKLLPR